jgi:hypothetical protein
VRGTAAIGIKDFPPLHRGNTMPVLNFDLGYQEGFSSGIEVKIKWKAFHSLTQERALQDESSNENFRRS